MEYFFERVLADDIPVGDGGDEGDQEVQAVEVATQVPQFFDGGEAGHVHLVVHCVVAYLH